MAAWCLLLLISPLATALKTQLKAKEDGGAEGLARKMANGKNHSWIMFMGDSNMRHTYYWWVTEKLAKNAKKIHKSKGFSLDGKTWGDQEAVVEFKDGFQVRTSLRFLHGSEHEFRFKISHFHNASRSPLTTVTDELISKTKLDEAEQAFTMDDKDAIEPSKMAKFMAQHQSGIDYEKESPFLARMFDKFENEKPGAIVLAEGWGGIPGCSRWEETLEVFKKNPEVNFVWAPIYVTNHQEKRHQCFSEKQQASAIPHNAKIIDMWDLVQTHLALLGGNQTRVAKGPDGTKHIGVGGGYMAKATDRFMQGIEKLEDES